MAKKLQEGDRVRVVNREPTPEEIKAGTFFNHYRDLVGTIQKIYEEKEAAIVVDPQSLPEGISKRHVETEEQMRTKWLDGLSEEARNRLTPQERAFALRYVVLVELKDLVLLTEEKPQTARAKQMAEGDTDKTDVPTPPRKTSRELDAAEEEELARRRQRE